MRPVRWWTLLVLLAGVLLMTYGHLHQVNAVLGAGLLVTLAGVLTGVIQLVVRGDR